MSGPGPAGSRGPAAAPGRTTRLLGPDDAAASARLGSEAFGYPDPGPDEQLPDPGRGGRTWVGTVEGDDLVARACALPYRTWWGGREVPTAGVASVAVRLEERGAGSLAPVLDQLHDRARERGDVLSLLFPTAPAIYRRFGYETVTSYDQVELLTRELQDARTVASTDQVRLRRAGAGDYDVVRAVYTAWASAQDGPLTRTGALFAADGATFLERLEGARVTLAEEHGQVTGYAIWRRTDGYHGGTTQVEDLVATSPGAYAVLLRHLGTSHHVAPRTTLWTSGADVVRTFLPGTTWRGIDCRPAMLAVLDVVGALEARGYPEHLRADLAFAVTGPEPVAGSYVLRVAAGRARCTRTEQPAGRDGIRTLDPRGLALAFAGAQPSSAQRATGLLSGPTGDDERWDALGGGRQVHVRDYF
ncbi:GNAT family N-acetyltransferase [Arsenicicoccus dermatophilus]|uniref:GNAT family N-acetyltransferase n=1 Tax=Arsenicicoccus dermatophilus TaxID=1076331 RepID=UPI001F4D1619|nr:GNAT family N-acetyltransferase [Arsenicicoccus dermatophilus]